MDLIKQRREIVMSFIRELAVHEEWQARVNLARSLRTCITTMEEHRDEIDQILEGFACDTRREVCEAAQETQSRIKNWRLKDAAPRRNGPGAPTQRGTDDGGISQDGQDFIGHLGRSLGSSSPTS